MGEGELDLKELKMVNLETGQEVQVEPIKEIEFSEKEGELEENLEWFYHLTQSFELVGKSASNAEKRLKKLFENIDKVYITYNNPLTKKRTKKILMSRGYSRNDANALLEDIEHRTMSHLDKFFPKNN